MRAKGSMPGAWNNCGLNHDTFEIKEMYHEVVEEIFGKPNSRLARSERLENSRFHRSFSSLGKVPMNTSLNNTQSDNTIFQLGHETSLSNTNNENLEKDFLIEEDDLLIEDLFDQIDLEQGPDKS